MKFSSLAQTAKPESPKQNAISIIRTHRHAHNRTLFLDAVAQAMVSGVIEPTYDKLPADVKAEFSFKTFERKLGF